MLNIVLLVFTYSGLCFSLSYEGTIKRVWPLDSFACTSEVLNSNWNQNSCSYLFGLPSTNFSDETMLFNGLNYVDLNVDFTSATQNPYIFGAFIYQNMSSGAIFHYKSDSPGIESILWIRNGVLKITRKTSMNQESVISGSTEIPPNTWTYVAFTISQNGGFGIYIDTNLEVSTSSGVRNDAEVPGSLRVGSGFDSLYDGFTGQIACISFTYNETQPGLSEAEQICGNYREYSTASVAEPMSVAGMCTVLFTLWMLQRYHQL